MKIDGKEIAEQILTELKERVDKLKRSKNITPKLAIVFIGKNRNSEIYVKRKGIAADKVGIEFGLENLPENTEQFQVEALIKKLARDNTINGLIVQRPIPKNYSTEKLTELVGLSKDIDGFLPGSRFTPPIAAAVLKVLRVIFNKSAPEEKNFIRWLDEKNIVLIGRGETAGVPIAKTFTKNHIKFIQVHTQTKNREKIIKNADIIISSVGKPNILTSSNIKKDVVLIGVGLYEEAGKLKGDYTESEIENVASFYTPTPGGTGPINVACLMENIVEAAQG